MYTTHVKEIYFSAINAVHPQSLIPQHVQVEEPVLHICGQKFRIPAIDAFVVIAAGKAAPAMACALEEQLGHLITKGICITKYGHALPLNRFQVLESAHPIPDENSLLAGSVVLEAVQHLSVNSLVLLLLSGGASSLVADVPVGVTLAGLQDIFKLLVACGASIQEINTVRKHLSKIKGGKLAKAAHPAKIITMAISDVVGDDISSIASGPAVADDTTVEDAYKVLLQYNIWNRISESIRKYIVRKMNNEVGNTHGSSLVYLHNSISKIVGNSLIAIEAARLKALHLGYNVVVAEENMTGDTVKTARDFIRYLMDYRGTLPACILMGGETTVAVTGNGKGGRNQHFVLSALNEILMNNLNPDQRRIIILGAGTDGTDGPTDAAGALIDTGMYRHGAANNKLIQKCLSNFDAYHYFSRNGGLFKTGPTQTNVMDIVIAIIADR